MENFKYGLIASFIGVLAFVAYNHPFHFKKNSKYLSWILAASFILYAFCVMIFSKGMHVSYLYFYENYELKNKTEITFSDFEKNYPSLEYYHFIWYLISHLYIIILQFLPQLIGLKVEHDDTEK